MNTQGRDTFVPTRRQGLLVDVLTVLSFIQKICTLLSTAPRMEFAIAVHGGIVCLSL